MVWSKQWLVGQFEAPFERARHSVPQRVAGSFCGIYHLGGIADERKVDSLHHYCCRVNSLNWYRLPWLQLHHQLQELIVYQYCEVFQAVTLF